MGKKRSDALETEQKIRKKKSALTFDIVYMTWQYLYISTVCCAVKMKSLLSGQMVLSYVNLKPVRNKTGSK